MEDIILTGGAQDLEDGELNGISLSWISDIDGAVGTGQQLFLPAKTLSPGEHEITLTATDNDGKTATASVTVFIARAQEQVLNASGKLTMLRVHDVGTAYGPPTDRIDVEVVIKLDSQPGRAFGFQLRNDATRPAHQGMLDLLRDAFNHNWTVAIDYRIAPGKNNGVILRAWLTK